MANKPNRQSGGGKGGKPSGGAGGGNPSRGSSRSGAGGSSGKGRSPESRGRGATGKGGGSGGRGRSSTGKGRSSEDRGRATTGRGGSSTGKGRSSDGRRRTPRNDDSQPRRGSSQQRRGSDRQSRDRSQPRSDQGPRRNRARGSGGQSADRRRQRAGAAESIVKRGAKGNLELPHWVRESVIRVTPKARVEGALQALELAAEAFVNGQYKKAVSRAEQAKKLSPREATVRELLGLSAYRTAQWELALRELRTYRRLSGDTTHLPVEMDTLRALNKPADVEKSWSALQELGGSPATLKEGKVVYGSFLIDSGDARKAWEVTRPRKMREDPFEEDLRVWYVAARAAGHLGDGAALAKIRDAIVSVDASFPGLDDLDSLENT